MYEAAQAFELISLAGQHEEFNQLALDILHRNGNEEEMAGIYLSRGHVIDALRVLKTTSLDKALCLRILESAWLSADRKTKYVVFTHLRDIKKVPFLDGSGKKSTCGRTFGQTNSLTGTWTSSSCSTTRTRWRRLISAPGWPRSLPSRTCPVHIPPCISCPGGRRRTWTSPSPRRCTRSRSWTSPTHPAQESNNLRLDRSGVYIIHSIHC